MDILSNLQGIFHDVFDDDSLVLTRKTSFEDIEEWDSLAQVSIVVSCESEFGIKFDLNEIVQLKNAGDIVDKVESKLRMSKIH